jgi:hypothetical protein
MLRVIRGSEGSFENFETVANAMNGAYGAWVNTDGFTVGEMRETYCGMRIFEIAKQSPSMRHFVYSSLDYSTKVCCQIRLTDRYTKFLAFRKVDIIRCTRSSTWMPKAVLLTSSKHNLRSLAMESCLGLSSPLGRTWIC